MKIAVCIKAVPDTACSIRVSQGMKSIDSSFVTVMNPFDEFALEEALRIKDQDPGAEVLALCFGPDRASAVIQSALALGADRALHVEQDPEIYYDGLSVAAVLHRALVAEEVDLVLMGKQSSDSASHQVGPMLAELLGWAQATDVVEMTLEADRVLVCREEDEGPQQLLSLTRPCLVAVTKGINKPRYPLLKSIMASKHKKVSRITLAELAPDAGLMHGIEVEELALVTRETAGRVVDGDPEACARELLAYLVEHKVVPSMGAL